MKVWSDGRVQSGCILSAGESIVLRDGMSIVAMQVATRSTGGNFTEDGVGA